MRHATILLLAVCAVVVAAPCGAITITVDGVRAFDALGFENDTVGALPKTTWAGGWIVDEKITPSAVGSVKVVGPGSPGPGAAYGSNYLAMKSDVGAGGVNMCAMAVLPTPAAPGAQVVAEVAMYVDSTLSTKDSGSWDMFPLFTFTRGLNGYRGEYNTWMSFTFGSVYWFGGTTPILNSVGHQEGQLYAIFHDGAYHNLTTGGGTTNMYVNPDEWVRVKISLLVGDKYTVTLNGVESDPIKIETARKADLIKAFQVFTNGPTTAPAANAVYYLDSVPVPEPGLAAMACGLALSGLALRRGRQRLFHGRFLGSKQ